MKTALQVNRRERRLLHDNAKVYTVKVTWHKLEELEWEILPHPPYSPNLAPSDYHLFRSLPNDLVTKRFHYKADLKSDLDVFLSSLSKKFFEEGIMDLPKREEYVIDDNGVDLID